MCVAVGANHNQLGRMYVLQCVAVCCSVLLCVTVRCSALQCVLQWVPITINSTGMLCCSVLQCVAVRCSVCVVVGPITIDMIGILCSSV